MPRINEDNSYNSLFGKPEDPLISTQAERITAKINQLKNDLKEANFLLKNGKLSPEAHLKLEAAVAIYRIKLEQHEQDFRNIIAQYRMQ